MKKFLSFIAVLCLLTATLVSCGTKSEKTISDYMANLEDYNVKQLDREKMEDLFEEYEMYEHLDDVRYCITAAHKSEKNRALVIFECTSKSVANSLFKNLDDLIEDMSDGGTNKISSVVENECVLVGTKDAIKEARR